MTRPASWELAPLLDVCTARMGPTILAKDLTDEGLPVYSAGGGDMPWGHTTLPVEQFSRGTIVLAARGSIGNPRLPDQAAFTSTQTTIALRGGAGLDYRYLKHFLGSIPWADVTSGAAIPMLTIGKLGELSIPIAPAAEQRRIADKLDTVLARVDAVNDRLARVAPLLKRFRQSVLAAATSGRLTEEWRASSRISDAWEVVRLPAIGELGRGKSKHRPRNDPRLYGGETAFIQTGDVAGADGWIAQHSQTYSKFGVAQSKVWPAGTLCITIAANIADTALLSYEACFPDSVVGFVAHTSRCLPQYVKWWIDVLKDDLERLAPATAQKNINLSTLEKVEVRLPALTEQTEIVRRVELLFAYADRLEARLQAAQTAAERLTPALLAKAFRGELVPQDPSDEPASELLKRLTAQRPPARPRGRKPAARTNE